jgi:hypothetical protein
MKTAVSRMVLVPAKTVFEPKLLVSQLLVANKPFTRLSVII